MIPFVQSEISVITSCDVIIDPGLQKNVTDVFWVIKRSFSTYYVMNPKNIYEGGECSETFS